MERRPLISVIVPVYKVEAFLPKCVDSIRNQTYKDLEIILVDDGSPDNCGAMCDAFAEEDPRIKVIHKPNGGLSDARNAGIEIASGEYLGFVDSDDWIEPEMYETMLALAQKHEVKLVCAGRYDVSERTGQRTKGLCPEREEVVSGQELAGRIFLWQGLDSAAWDKLYHRSLWQTRRYPFGRVNEACLYLLSLISSIRSPPHLAQISSTRRYGSAESKSSGSSSLILLCRLISIVCIRSPPFCLIIFPKNEKKNLICTLPKALSYHGFVQIALCMIIYCRANCKKRQNLQN